MAEKERIRLGLIGLGQRGYTLLETILATGQADVAAVCDVYEDRRLAAVKKVTEAGRPAPVQYADYRALLEDKSLRAVFIASSWEGHIRMAIDCMQAGKITAMEVGGAYDVEECRELVRAYEQTKTPFMFMENCCYGQFELLSTNLARAGKLGTIVHCHGAYGTICATKF